jgi:hypothetical protein
MWLAIGFIIAIAIIASGLWVYLQYLVYQQVYSVKADLDWFAIVFYHNYTFVVAALFSLLLINPQIGHSDLWSLEAAFGPRNDYGQVGPRRLSNMSWTAWQFLKWALSFIYFVVFGGPPIVGNVMNSVMMMVTGIGSWSNVPRIFILPLLPASGNDLINLMPTIEVQYRLLQACIQFFLIIFAIRIILRLSANIFSSGEQQVRPQWLGTLLATVVIVSLVNVILGAPYWLMDVRTPFIYGIAWALFLLFVLLWTSSRLSGRELFTISGRGLVKSAVILLGLILVVQLGIVVFYTVNWNNNYVSYEWTPKTQKEITVTQWAAGLNNIKVGSLLALPTSRVSTILNLTRQWDQQAASVTMTKDIGAYNWMALASSNIVFVNNTEYWISPTTPAYPATDWISEHMIYTHAARVMVINTHSGAEVSLNQSFSIRSEPLIYYGEEPQSGSGGFYNNVYVHVPGYQEIQNQSYEGPPDYTLTGWQKSMWFTMTEGQLGFAFTSYPIEMLWNRDIFTRVQSILIPGLVIDPAAYLTSDGKNMYYVLQIYIDYPLQSGFSASPYLRFFGVVLVNVYDGSLHGYTVSNLLGTNSTDFITSFYNKYYSSWGPAPEWLVPQIRYPEQLLGNPSVPGQLDYDFTFHVGSSTNAFVWRSGSQFYERPPLANTIQYIPWAVGNSTYFVGVQPVSYVSTSSQNLAGLYIAYAGDRLGQIYIYQNPSPSNTFINPTAAENALTTNSKVRTQLTLLPNYRVGTYLLYSVGGRLLYFVAVYTNPGTSGVVTQLPFMTTIDPLTGIVGMSSTTSITSMSASAYNDLVGVAVPPSNVTVSAANSVTLLHKGIESLVSKDNDALVNATVVSALVQIRADTVPFNSLGVNQTVARVATFLQSYGPKASGNTVYEWIDGAGNLDIGIFMSGQPVATLEYVAITL